MIWQPKPADRVCVVGNTGCGKSVWAKAYRRNIYRCVVFDPLQESPMGGGSVSVSFFCANRNRYRSGSLRISVYPDRFDAIGMAEDFNSLCEAIYDIGALCFCIEELSFVCSPSRVPDNFGRLAAAGRHRAVSLCCIGQRFAQFPLLVRGAASRIIAYRQQDPADVKDLVSRIGEEADRAPFLKNYYYLDWDAQRGVISYSPINDNTELAAVANDNQERPSKAA